MPPEKRAIDWRGLAAISEDLECEVQNYYHSLVQFDGAFDDQKGAAELVAELLGDKKPAAEVERISAQLWQWREKREEGASFLPAATEVAAGIARAGATAKGEYARCLRRGREHDPCCGCGYAAACCASE